MDWVDLIYLFIVLPLVLAFLKAIVDELREIKEILKKRG